MEDSKNLDHYDEIPDKNTYKEELEIKNKEPELKENVDVKLNQNKNLNININKNNIHKQNNKVLEVIHSTSFPLGKFLSIMFDV